jgi:hypothetical protein
MAISNLWDMLPGGWQDFADKNGLGFSDAQALSQQGFTPDTAKDQLKQLSGAVGVGAIPTFSSGNAGAPWAQQSTGFQGGLSMGDMIRLSGALGGGTKQPAQPQGPGYNIGNTPTNPLYGANLLGAQALTAVGLNPSGTMVVNPSPAQTPTGSKQFAKSGVSPVSQPTVMDISGVQRPQGVVPSIFYPAQAVQPSVPTGTSGIIPTPQPTAAQIQPTGGVPFAGVPPIQTASVPPAAPGVPAVSPFAIHTSALADAGKALYAHFGGDPSTATHADIANFHNELQGALAGGPPIKRRSGGIVPGSGTRDSVPAMLTPGEYVMNKAAVNKIGVGNLEHMNNPRAFAGGGYVDDDQQQPREARHRLVTGQPSQPSSSTTPPPAPSQPSQSQQPASQSASSGGNDMWQQAQQLATMRAMATMRQNAALSANLPAYPSATTPAAQGYAAAANAGQISGSAPTAAQVQSAAAMTPGQIQGSIAEANMPAAGAIGGLASGLAAAAQKYAESVKPWQIQPSAIPNPADIYRPQPVTFSQALV